MKNKQMKKNKGTLKRVRKAPKKNFQAAAPLLDVDKTLWILSAWNDNGFTHLVHDAKHLQRTDFMPGLGWLMPRAVWENELKSVFGPA